MSLIKVAWYVSRVKNMHLGSPSDPGQTPAAKAKPRYVYSILKPHGQTSRGPVRPLPPRQSRSTYTQFQNHMVRVSEGKSDCYIKLRILNFETTWSEFQKHRQTAAMRGEAELRIYNLKKNITSPESVPSSCVRQHT